MIYFLTLFFLNLKFLLANGKTNSKCSTNFFLPTPSICTVCSDCFFTPTVHDLNSSDSNDTRELLNDSKSTSSFVKKEFKHVNKPQTNGKSSSTKTSEGKRFNFASFDCGAIIREANKEAKSISSILQENKDSYLLNECSSTKYVVIELCEEVLVNEIHLANLEYFSSTFRTFQVYLSDTYPVNQWKPLLRTNAKNLRQIQVFETSHNNKWAKFMKIEFLTHYGNEYYCPVTLIRVFGRNAFEDLRISDAEDSMRMPNNDNHKEASDSEKSSHQSPSNRSFLAGDYFDQLSSANITNLVHFDRIKELEELENEILNYTSTSSNSDTKDSVLKSMMKKLLRLEQNVNVTQSYLYKQQKELYKLYLDLEVNLRKRVDVFLDLLGKSIATSMDDMRYEYESLFDDLVKDVRQALFELRIEIGELRDNINTLSFNVKTLERWSILQLILAFVIWRFWPQLVRRYNSTLSLLNITSWFFKIETEDIKIKKALSSFKKEKKPSELKRRKSVPH